MKRASALAALLASLNIAVLPRCAASQTTQQGGLDATISYFNRQVAGWNSDANWQAAIMIATIVIGGLIAAFQLSKQKNLKVVTAVLGVVASVLTGINAKVFTADYTSLRRAASKGDGIIGQLYFIEGQINYSHPTGKQLEGLLAQAASDAQEFKNIQDSLGVTSTASAAGEGLLIFHLPLVFAQATPPAPAWISQTPSSPGFLYFVGTGTDAQIPIARQNSLEDAQGRAIQQIGAMSPGYSIDTIKSLVTGSYATQDTYLAFNRSSNAYTFYTLVRVSTLVLSFSKPAFQIYQQGGWRPADLTSHGALIITLDESGGISTVYADSQGPHVNLLFRLPGAMEGAAVTADDGFVYASANSRLGCTIVRYSLSSHATDNRLIAAHQRCIGIASDGSTLYVQFPDQHQILYVKSWARDASSWDFGNLSLGPLIYDRIAKRLLAAGPEGNAYSISVINGSFTRLISNLGYVESLAVSTNYILAASGKKILFVNRATNSGANPPAGFGQLPGGALVGVTVDDTGGVWIADYDHQLVEGPFHI